MAKHCTNCGHELRGSDKFCAECGTTVEGQVPSQTETVQWEYCEIDIIDAGKKPFWGPDTYQWVAKAMGPKGMYEAGRSARNDGWPRGYIAMGTPQTPTGTVRARYERELHPFVQQLVTQGWQPVSEHGREWYSYKFRRPVKG